MDNLLVGLLPLILFVIIDSYQGTKKGVYWAIGLSTAIVVYSYLKTQQWDWLIFGELVLLLIMGGISLKLNDSKYFKLQPALLSVVFALLFSGFLLAGHPFLIEILPHLEALNPQLKYIKEDPQMLFLLSRISHWMIYLFVIHGLALSFAAIKWSSKIWLLVRISIYPGMAALWFLAVII